MLAITGYFLASWLVLQLPALPDWRLLLIALPLAIYLLRVKGAALLGGALLGACFTLAASEAVLEGWVGVQDEGKVQVVHGRVVGLPRSRGSITRFQFIPLAGEPVQGRLVVSWYEPEARLAPGQLWRFGLRINRPSGQLNFGLFDYEKWLFSQGITGHAKVAQPRQQLGTQGAVIDRLRDRLRQQVIARLGPGSTAGVIVALMTGDTSGIDPAAWRVFSFTGVIHLLIISGLHIGIIGFLAWQVCRLLGMSLWLCILTTVPLTFLYAQLAGWGLPVQRAFIMVTSVLLLRGLARRASPMMHFAWAAGFVMLLQPLTLLSQGAWLSFGAVALLMAFVNERQLEAQGWAARLGTMLRAQWVIFVGMAPLLLTMTGYLAGGALFVNMIAIPFVTFLLVPAVLLTALVMLLSEAVSGALLTLLGVLVGWMLNLLDSLASLSPLIYPQTAQGWGALALRYSLLLAGCLILLAPKGLVPKWLGLLCCCCLLQKDKPAEALAMTFFDVGQGLSVLVEVEGSLILYDTGPAFGDGYSAARQVVLPAIRRKGYDFIDLLVISHGDNDHAGGLADIGETLPIGRLVEGDACTGAWRWGRAAFRLLSAWQLKGNDNSCLLEISLGETRLLLTGDIGTRAEYQLLDDLLPYVTVMSAPHHGSDTSSSPALLNHTWPQLVVASTGYRNRFQHPSELVKQRYLNRHILFLDTAEEGAIRVGFQQDGSYRVKRARDSQPALWRRRRAADDAL